MSISKVSFTHNSILVWWPCDDYCTVCVVRWMRDGLLGFPDVLGEDKDDDDVDLDMSTKAVVRVKDEENAQKFNYVLDVELVEYCNEKNSIITSRNDFTENLQQHLLRQRNESNSDVVEKDGNKELLSFDLDDAIR